MPSNLNNDQLVFQRVKGILKTLAISQKDLAKQLGLAQGVVSLALNGGNEKTFRRIIDLLVQEHQIDPQHIYGETERGDKILTQLEEIKEELQQLKSGIEEVKRLLKSKK